MKVLKKVRSTFKRQLLVSWRRNSIGNLINVQKIQQHFIMIIKLTREVPRPLIYKRKDELLSIPCKLSR